MLQKLKFKEWSPQQNYYFVSCLHFGHDREFIYKPRGYNNIVEHDEGIIAKWNENITSNDIVFSIGDNVFGYNADKRLEEYFRRLNFNTLYISPGNHYSGYHQLYKKFQEELYGVDDIEIVPLRYKFTETKTIVFVPNYYEIYIGNQALVLCHYPIFPHNGAGKGVWGIFGHCHGKNEKTNIRTGTGKVIDVCIESMGRPISYPEIANIFKHRASEDVGHHTDKTTYAI